MAQKQRVQIPVQQTAGLLVTEAFAVGRIADKDAFRLAEGQLLEGKGFRADGSGQIGLTDMTAGKFHRFRVDIGGRERRLRQQQRRAERKMEECGRGRTAPSQKNGGCRAQSGKP